MASKWIRHVWVGWGFASSREQRQVNQPERRNTQQQQEKSKKKKNSFATLKHFSRTYSADELKLGEWVGATFESVQNYVKLSGCSCSWEFPNYLISLIMLLLPPAIYSIYVKWLFFCSCVLLDGVSVCMYKYVCVTFGLGNWITFDNFTFYL